MDSPRRPLVMQRKRAKKVVLGASASQSLSSSGGGTRQANKSPRFHVGICKRSPRGLGPLINMSACNCSDKWAAAAAATASERRRLAGWVRRLLRVEWRSSRSFCLEVFFFLNSNYLTFARDCSLLIAWHGEGIPFMMMMIISQWQIVVVFYLIKGN